NFAPDPRGRWVATGDNGTPVTLTLLDAGTGTAVRQFDVDPHFAEDANERADTTTVDRMFTPDGSRLLTFHVDGTVRAWDPETGKEVVRMKSDTDGAWRPGGLACSPDGKWVACRGNRDFRSILVWEL